MKRNIILFIVCVAIFVAFVFKKDYMIITINNPSIIASSKNSEQKIELDKEDLTFINSSIANYGFYTRYCLDIEKKKSNDNFEYIVDIEDNNGIKKYCYLVGEKGSFLYIYPTTSNSYKYHIFKIAYNDFYAMLIDFIQRGE